MFLFELDVFGSYIDSRLLAKLVIDKYVGIVKRVKPDRVIASAGHAEECSGDGGASGLAFRAADIKIGYFVRESIDELDYRHRMSGLESTNNARIFDIVESDIQFVALIVFKIFILSVRADDDGIPLIGQVKRKLKKLRVKCRNGKDVDRVTFAANFCPSCLCHESSITNVPLMPHVCE